jgi:hypothetical protein
VNRIPAIAILALLFVGVPVFADDNGVVWLDVIELNSNEVDRLIRAGHEFLGTGNAGESADAFRAAHELAPDRVDALLLELSVRVQMEQWAGVLERTDAIATSTDASPDVVRALFFRAIALAATGEFTEGAALLQRVSRFRSDLNEAHLYYGNLAELHMANGDYDRAILFYQQAVSCGGRAAAHVGLALALERAGRPDDAAPHVLRAVLEDPEASFLDEDGLFFVPEGDLYFYHALIALARGDIAQASASLDAVQNTPAGEASPDLIASLRDRTTGGGATITRHSVPACIPTHLALSPDREKLAVLCEYAAMRVVDRSNEGVRVSEITGDGYYSYTRADITYAPNGASIRVLQTDGVAIVYQVGISSITETNRVQYDDYTLMPQRFIGAGDRVLLSGSSSGGFQTEAWDTTPLQPNLTYATNVHWLQFPQMSMDEQVLTTIDGTELRIMRPPSWTEAATVRLTTGQSRFTPHALSPSGQFVVVAHGTMLVRYSSVNGTPVSVVSMANDAPEIDGDPYVGISSIKAVDDDTYLVGTSNWVHVVEFE